MEDFTLSMNPSTTCNTTCFSRPVCVAISLTISAFVILTLD
nr:MAG TPA: disulfide-rich peptide [Caudoviricetes sp.]DAO94994.1 MAG TPA: disulfide-rich peptide [Caudoviricetes sp.]